MTAPSPERPPADTGGDLLPCPFCGGRGDPTSSRGGSPGTPEAGGTEWVECEDCAASGPGEPKPFTGAAWNRRAPAPQARPDARAVEVAGYFLHTGDAWEEVSDEHIGDRDVRPLYLSAPAADDGWRPSREEVARIVWNAFTGNPAIWPKVSPEQHTAKYCWRAADAILALHPAAPTDEVGKS